MTVESPTWRVGIAGLNPSSLFAIEQLSLDSRFQIVQVAVTNPLQAHLIGNSRYQVSTQPASVLASKDADIFFVNEEVPFDAVTVALRQGKRIVCQSPWMFSADQWGSLKKYASSEESSLAAICAQIRWSSEFVASESAIRSNRLGRLKSIRMTSWEKTIPPRAVVDVLREVGFERLFQLASLVTAPSRSVYARRFYDDDKHDVGFLAVIEFADGCLAQIEINIESRLSLRTGWILEGTTGSYRNDRLYTTAEDGEFVDEPLVPPAMPSVSFGDEITRLSQLGEHNAQHVDRIIRTMRLIESIERSTNAGMAVDA